MFNDKTYNTILHYKYNCCRIGNKIIFEEIDDQRNKIATQYLIKITKLRHKEIFKKLTLKELNNVKTIIEEVISEKQTDIKKGINKDDGTSNYRRNTTIF